MGFLVFAFQSHGITFTLQNQKKNLKPFPVIYNEPVYQWVYFFVKSKKYVFLWLKRSYRYIPIMKTILKEHGLPEELAYMTLVESSLSPQATSRAQAVGYWQFIQPTALRFGLRINNWLDERRDFQKSTEAAARYLSNLYTQFDDWLLAMAAYNMGENRLVQFMKKYPHHDFWKLSQKRDFPAETSSYVPKILAALHIIKNPQNYGFDQFPILPPYRYDIFYTPGGTNLKALSQDMPFAFSEIKKLNPELKTAFIPSEIYHYPLKIPKGNTLKISKWLKNKKN